MIERFSGKIFFEYSDNSENSKFFEYSLFQKTGRHRPAQIFVKLKIIVKKSAFGTPFKFVVQFLLYDI